MKAKPINPKAEKAIKIIDGTSQLIGWGSAITMGALNNAGLSASQIASAVPPTAFTSMSFMGLGFITGSILDAFRLRELWTKQGHYAKLYDDIDQDSAEKTKLSLVDTKFKQQKVTTYILFNRALLLSLLIIQTLTLAGVMTMASPTFMAIMGVGITYHLGKGVFSLVRVGQEYKVNKEELDYLLKTESDENRIKELQERQAVLKYKIVNNTIKMTSILLITAIIAGVGLTSGPLAFLVIPATLLVVFAVLAIYHAVLKPKMKKYFIKKAMTQPSEKIQPKNTTKIDEPLLRDDPENIDEIKPHQNRHLFWLKNNKWGLPCVFADSRQIHSNIK